MPDEFVKDQTKRSKLSKSFDLQLWLVFEGGRGGGGGGGLFGYALDVILNGDCRSGN